MKRIFYFSVILLTLSGLQSCNSNQNNNLTMLPLTEYRSLSETKSESVTASQIYLKTKNQAKKWSKDSILVYINSTFDSNWYMYYYSKEKAMMFVYYGDDTGFNEVKLTDVQLIIKPPYMEIENWKIDSKQALTLAGKNEYTEMAIVFNQNSQKMEWKIEDYYSSIKLVYVDINTGSVRKPIPLR